jgi:hypothetical protein
MKRVTVFATAVALMLMAVFSWTAAAQQPDTRDRTIMTFSNAVELPGMRLEAGTYVFRLADTQLRNIIQVLPQDEKEVLGQWLFIPAERQEVTGDTVVTFRETAANTTPAVQFWYYPGEKIGKEFIYPKDQAMRIAQRTGVGVMTEDGRVTAGGQVAASTETTQAPASVQAEASVTSEPAPVVEAQASTTGVVEGSGLPAESTTASADVDANVAVGTSGQVDTSADARPERTMAQANTGAQNNNANADNNVASELPSTASPLALSGLLGLLSLMGAAGIRTFRL